MWYLICMSDYVWENLKFPILTCIIAIILTIIFVVTCSKRHKKFINKAKKLCLGMSKNQVLSIMGEYPTSTERDENKEILIWEKSQWKGIQHGGTVTRGVKVVLVDGKVYDISNKNMNKSTFW